MPTKSPARWTPLPPSAPDLVRVETRGPGSGFFPRERKSSPGAELEPGKLRYSGVTVCLGNANSLLQFLPSRGSKYVPCHFTWRVSAAPGTAAAPVRGGRPGTGGVYREQPVLARPQRRPSEGSKHGDLGL